MTDTDRRADHASERAGSGARKRPGDGGDADEPPVVRTGMDATEARTNRADREFGRRGAVLLGVMFVALVVAPLVVYLRPPALSWRVTLVVFPLVPALALGLVAVWATTRP